MITALTALILCGCTDATSVPKHIKYDTDTRPVAERMSELYGTDFTLISEQKDLWTLQDKNGLECHVIRYLDEFNMPENTASEVFCDDYYAACIGELPEMQKLTAERGAYILASKRGEAAERYDYAHFMIPCSRYEDIADIYSDTLEAGSAAPNMYYGQIGHWCGMLPMFELIEATSGERLALIQPHPVRSEKNLREAQDCFTELCYQQGRRDELPDAAVMQCPQSGMYLIDTGNDKQYLSLVWDRHAQIFAVNMDFKDDGTYRSPEELYRLLAACGAIEPEDMYGSRITTDDLIQFFDVTLDIDPLTMTGAARKAPPSDERRKENRLCSRKG